MLDRRSFLAATGVAPALLEVDRVAEVCAAADARRRTAAADARDETLWAEIARAFTVDRSQVNLNNGGCSPAPWIAQEALKRHLDFSNKAPPYAMWRELEPQKEAVRQRLARQWAVDPEEVAIVRNTTEALHVCQMGIDLVRGDEVLTTDQDYPRMIHAFRQREMREGIVLKQIELPVPAEDDDEVVARFAEAITERTRMILVCHMINLTGQILPVRQVVELGRSRGIPVVVDGAHALAHFQFTLPDLACDYYGTSLHKWLCAPVGAGLLYVRGTAIENLWPLFGPDPDLRADIRKFEQLGTHPIANFLAIAEALTLHQTIGGGRKQERLVYLRDRWARRLLQSDRVTLHTSLQPGRACGIANVRVDGLEVGELAEWLWRKHHILVTPIGHERCPGLRVSPNVYTTLEEIDRFSEAMEHAIRFGIE